MRFFYPSGYLAPLRQALPDDFGFQARIDHITIYGFYSDYLVRKADANSPQGVCASD